jgi:anti-anti-sigma factor
VAFGCTLFVGLLEGILIAAGMSMVLVIQKAVVPHGAVLGQIADNPPVYRNVERFPDAKEVDGVLIYRLDAPLFFANAELWKDRMHSLLQAKPSTTCIVLHCGAVAYLDSTGAHAVEGFMKECKRHNRQALFAELNGPCRDMLGRVGLMTSVLNSDGKADQENGVFLTLADAVVYAKKVALSTSATVVAEDFSIELEAGQGVTAADEC